MRETQRPDPARGPPYMISLLRRGPPKGTKGRLPVAAWYRVTPMLQRSTVTPNAFCWGLRSTARSYMSGCCQRDQGADVEGGAHEGLGPRPQGPQPPDPLPLPSGGRRTIRTHILCRCKHWRGVGLSGAFSFARPLPWESGDRWWALLCGVRSRRSQHEGGRAGGPGRPQHCLFCLRILRVGVWRVRSNPARCRGWDRGPHEGRGGQLQGWPSAWGSVSPASRSPGTPLCRRPR